MWILKYFQVAILIVCFSISVADGNAEHNPRTNNEMPLRHRFINGLKLGKPVRKLDEIYSNQTQQYLLLSSYAEGTGCSGDPLQLASIATGVCFQADDKYTEYYTDDYNNFYDDIWDYRSDEGKTRQANQPKNDGNIRRRPPTDPQSDVKAQYYHYIQLYSVVYSLTTLTTDGVTNYVLNTTSFTNNDCTGRAFSTILSVSNECTESNGAYPFYYSIQLNNALQTNTISTSSLVVPSSQGVLFSYYYSENTCIYGGEIAPYSVWEPIGVCLPLSDYYSEMFTSCSYGYAYYEYYSYSGSCLNPYYYYAYQYELYSLCYYGEYRTVSCTGTPAPSNAPSRSPTHKPTSRPSGPTIKPSQAPKMPTAKPTKTPSYHAPTMSPTFGNVVAVFTVDQVIGNVTVDDMSTYQAVNAFVTAAYEALNSATVQSVDVSQVQSYGMSAKQRKLRIRQKVQVQRRLTSTSSVDVSYAVTFEVSGDQVNSVYYQLTTSLAYSVAYGYFQSYLQSAANAEYPVPTALLSCQAESVPSASYYTVVTAQDDYWTFDDDYWTFDDDDDNDSPHDSNKKQLDTSSIAGIVIAGVAFIAIIVVAVYVYFFYSPRGYQSGQLTAAPGMETANPIYNPSNQSIELNTLSPSGQRTISPMVGETHGHAAVGFVTTVAVPEKDTTGPIAVDVSSMDEAELPPILGSQSARLPHFAVATEK